MQATYPILVEVGESGRTRDSVASSEFQHSRLRRGRSSSLSLYRHDDNLIAGSLE